MPSRLVSLLEGMEPFAVAFSGGVDSSLLCAVAAKAVGEGFIALTADTPFTHRSDIERACALAADLGFEHHLVRLDPLADPLVASNPPDRCYLCKKIILGRLLEEAAALGFTVLADGTNADDIQEDRPGLRALRGLGVRSPLAELGIGREGVVKMSVGLGLPDPHRLNTACLATRIPAGTAVTPDLLSLVEELERRVLALGFSFARVRTDGVDAGVELLHEEAGSLSPALVAALEEIVRSAGLRLSGIGRYGK